VRSSEAFAEQSRRVTAHDVVRDCLSTMRKFDCWKLWNDWNYWNGAELHSDGYFAGENDALKFENTVLWDKNAASP
jgi:hypothetical protein